MRLEHARPSHLQLHLPGRHEYFAPCGELRPLISTCKLLHLHLLRAEDCKESLAVPACRLAAPQALLQHNGLGNVHLIQRRYFLLQSHWPYPSWNAQIHSLKSALHSPVRPAVVDPRMFGVSKSQTPCVETVAHAQQRHSHARYTRSCTTAKNCQLQAKNSYQSRLRGCLMSGNLQAKQWWSTVKRAAGDKRGSDIPTLRNNNGELLITNCEKADAFGKFFSEKCSL